MLRVVSKTGFSVLARVAQWVGASTRTPRSRGFDSWSGCGLDPQSECVQEVTDQCFSLSLSISSLSLKSINKIKNKIKFSVSLNMGSQELGGGGQELMN